MTLLCDHILPSYKSANDNSKIIVAEIIDSANETAAEYIRTNADFFEWLAEGSPYLIGLMRRYPEVLAALLEQSPQDYCEDLRKQLIPSTYNTREEWMCHIRTIRNRIALAVGLADVAKLWNVEDVVKEMTALADCAVSSSVDWLFGEAQAADKITSTDQTGFIILALGKHGGEELNYSSDIDIVAYYTPNAIALADNIDERKFFVSLVKDLAHILQSRTEDGYVFRVDLRLRPDPGATPVAISVTAALSYYESMGQNWERAVYIKARPIAGDIAAGAAFLDDLSPYIWRRYFDFASIEDVHSMKRQIHAVRGHTHIAAAGHNIKLGRGGIREIEFFVQTQQLIAGGRDNALRGRRTIEMLSALAAHNWITQDVATGLTQSYYYLRQLEHRLQMQYDEQTQTLPADEETFETFAHFAGYETPEAFEEELLQHLSYVRKEYGHLFEQGESLAADSGNLVFTGGEDDPDTIETLATIGFKRPKDISGIIRSWHAGRLRATRSVRSREILTRLTPMLLQSLGQAADPDDAFHKFNNFLAELPSGVQFFSLVQSMPRVLDILVSFITITPHLAHRLSNNVNLLDMLIENRLPSASSLEIAPQADFQEVLDILRVHIHEAQFAGCIRMMSDPEQAHTQGGYFTDLADGAIAALLPCVLADIARRYSTITGAEIAIVGMGKLGSRELALQSDLDIIIICDCPDFAALSQATAQTKSIDADTWFARTARHILSGLSAQTAEGVLYEVDTRLRPSGQSGALVSKLSSFEDYQRTQAWSWEHMALTRGRVIAGTGGLGERIDNLMHSILCMPRDLNKLATDIDDMRSRLAEHHTQDSVYDIRNGAGGLQELEFICQSLQIAYAHTHPILAQSYTLPEALDILHSVGCIDADTHTQLKESAHCYSTLRQLISLSRDKGQVFTPTPAGLDLLLQASDMMSAPRLEEAIAVHRAFVASTLDGILKEWTA